MSQDRGPVVDRRFLEGLFDLSGRVALVTGATRGIGRAIAFGLGAAGAKVVVASRKPEACAETAGALGALGVEALGVPTHVGSLPDVEALVRASVEGFGRLDMVVNDAATALRQPLGAFSAEAWQKVFDVNLRGPVFLVQEALGHLKESPAPSVLNVISAAAFLASPSVSMYAAAKSALWSFTRSMAAEYAAFGIRVNALSPGTVDTDMVRANPPEVQRSLHQVGHFHRAATPEEMVGPALFLLSDASSFVTGHVVMADGGLVPF